jgi:hypothetical protein
VITRVLTTLTMTTGCISNVFRETETLPEEFPSSMGALEEGTKPALREGVSANLIVGLGVP